MGLLSLLPGRHADFELALEIHDLQNVPLVSGTFSVEWKFKSSKAHPEQVLQALTQTTTNSSTNTSASTNSTASDSNSPRSSSDSHNNDSSSASPSSDNRLSSSSSFSRINKTKSSLNLKKTAKRQLLSSSKNEHGKPLSSSSKGQTEGVEIRDHSCTWSQEVRSHIRVGVGAGKELGVLGERELRVVVHQVTPVFPRK
ncbi:hypothetical protein BDY24DRAFT_370018 [Mrakia frigida]|uniref:uncharacterized protein n=1 Tax=Mrakia frigida TaxID=29902 RepID=UPI003FCC048E